MEQKTAEEYLQIAYEIILENQSDKHKDVDPVLLNAMQHYADQEVIKALLDFQLWLNEKNLITNHDWDFENEAKKFMKSINKK